MAYVIAEPCIGVKDTACVDACPVDCIHPGKSNASFAEVPQLYIDPDNCICCGACLPVCPVSAIFLEEDVPLQWISYVQTNADKSANFR
jgi:NAD-dependent dihydropyrimidine dehydrogenase PreA subunit